jgi:hypothetical protein
MAKGKTAWAYLEGFGTLRSVLDLDSLTVDEILGALDPDLDWDPLLTPWKRGYQAAIREALGH